MDETINKMNKLKIKKLKDDAVLPTKAYPGDLGYDLYSNEDLILRRFKGNTLISTGIAIQFPDGYGGMIKDRSSMASKGITTSGGILDSNYRGEIKVILHNSNDDPYIIKKGDKIAQIVPIEVTDWKVEEVVAFDDNSSDSRGEKGFGSSGQ